MIRQQLITAENTTQISSFTLSDLIFYLDEQRFKQIITAKIINEVMRKISEEADYYNFEISNTDSNFFHNEKPKKVGHTYSNEIKSLCVEMFQAGESIKKIGRKIGITQRIIRKYIRKFKRGEIK